VANVTGLTAIFNVFFGFVYFIFFWVMSGYTPGQGLLGLRVIHTDGRPHLNLGRAVLRFIGLWIAALPLFLGFIWILFDNHRQGWHDKIARTYVIYTWDKKPHLLPPGLLKHAPSPPKELSASRQED
jgi:uncharacterized RDD family membrane protein YckC